MIVGRYYEGVGRRKSAVARVRLYAGNGTITVNDRPLHEYFGLASLIQKVQTPLQLTKNETRFNVSVHVTGGGLSGQADAISLGLARALVAADLSFKPILRQAGLLTRDRRVKERKKPGLKKARKAKQYTKR